MSQFIYQIEKKETEESVILKYYSVDAQKNTNIEETELNYVLYIKKDDFELINIKSDSIVLTTNEFFNKNKEKVVEIKFLNKEIYTYFKEKLRDSKIHTFFFVIH